MVKRQLFTAIVAGTVIALAACEQEPAPTDVARAEPTAAPTATPETDAEVEVHTTTGRVTAMDSSAARLTIAHEPVPSLQWPAMTMQFMVADSVLLEGIAEGDQVRFSFMQDDAGNSVIRELQSDDQ